MTLIGLYPEAEHTVTASVTLWLNEIMNVIEKVPSLSHFGGASPNRPNEETAPDALPSLSAHVLRMHR